MAESFWSTLKTEFYDRQRWPTRHAARKAVAYCIEVVYNRRRRRDGQPRRLRELYWFNHQQKRNSCLTTT
ncbi:IS3 family transposase [Corynebacterium propinquum]|uniref:IS3 family transposase n=1 Tax=Corynebacterium propinquum TaxID=43769 RepID=UPI003D6C7944